MNKEEKFFLPALIRLPLGPVKLARALKHFKTPKNIWLADPYEFNKIEGIADITIEKIKIAKQEIDPEKEYQELLANNIKFTTVFDDDYPYLLKQIYAPPIVLFYKGSLVNQNSEKNIAIVGTRNLTHYGKKIAFQIARDLVQNDFIITSGLARGVDSEAHLGALSANGITWAVLGCGLANIYPKENDKLLAKIIESGGAVFSEFPTNMPPNAENFPARNRIITGLSKGTVIVQCAKKSGAMISAQFAIEQDREVFAVPGNIDLEQSSGPNLLIKQGATAITSAEDILDFFSLAISHKPKLEQVLNLSLAEQKIYDIISFDPISFDLLVNKADLPIGDVYSILLGLELKSIIKQLPGQYYLRA